MPELPEVETIVSELQSEIKGKKIKNLEVRVPKMIWGNIKSVEGLKIEDVRRRAKLIILDLEQDKYIIIHLKLTGQLFLLPKNTDKTKTGEGINKFTHIIFNFEDSSRLIFNDLRKFGYVKILDSKGLEDNLKKENYGPEPLEPQFTLAKFKAMLSKRQNTRIKPLLLDQTFIAGIGNLYSDEILFFAGIHPKRKVKDLTKNEVGKIYKGIKQILNKALKYKGSSIDTYRTTKGERGTYEFHRKVYRRGGQKCLKCGSIIQSIKFGGRSAYFCPRCQK